MSRKCPSCMMSHISISVCGWTFDERTGLCEWCALPWSEDHVLLEYPLQQGDIEVWVELAE